MKAGWLGLVGFVLLTLWMVVIMGFSFVEAFILPLHLGVPRRLSWFSLDGMFNGGTRANSTLGSYPRLDADRAALHPRRPLVRHRDVPGPNSAAWRRRASGCQGPF